MAQSTSKTPAPKKSAVPPKKIATPEIATRKVAAPKPASTAKSAPTKAAAPKTAGSAKSAPGKAAAEKSATPSKVVTKKTSVRTAPSKGNGEAASTKMSSVVRSLGVVTPEQRYRMICDAAYFRAERRGFVGGNAVLDWLEAEAEIDGLLREMQQ